MRPPTFRIAAFRLAMARLALAAIVLLATLPTLGRLTEREASAGDAGWAAMCTRAGLAYVRLSGLPGEASRDAAMSIRDGGSGAPPHPQDADCAYCPLLAALVAAALWLLLAPHCDLRRLAVATARALPRVAVFHPCGLGSRGPPLLA